MHVTTRVVLLAMATAAVMACEARPDRTKKGAPPILTRATVSSAGSAAPLDPAFLPLARAAREAATKVASACQLHSEWGETYMRVADSCRFVAADIAALQASASALGAAPAPTNGAALVFAEEVRLFTAWVQLVRDGRSSGTLSHYQGLASAWNALQPSDRMPVDLRTKDASDGTVIVGGEGGKLAWTRCSSGPCIIVPRKDR